MSSSESDSALDFDRDLPTTQEDIEALRKCRAVSTPLDLRNINRLSPPDFFSVDLSLRPTFGDLPPFEL